MTGMPKLWLTAICWAAPYGVDLAGRSPSTLGLRCYHVRSVLGVSARDAIEVRHQDILRARTNVSAVGSSDCDRSRLPGGMMEMGRVSGNREVSRRAMLQGGGGRSLSWKPTMLLGVDTVTQTREYAVHVSTGEFKRNLPSATDRMRKCDTHQISSVFRRPNRSEHLTQSVRF
jgi:hypothetical protein